MEFLNGKEILIIIMMTFFNIFLIICLINQITNKKREESEKKDWENKHIDNSAILYEDENINNIF